ncbi:MAG: prephenate dehydrogenase/arogenate dehydrogenase family protein [Betaproteobacteria bacterium]|nr:prephenate dehydrogenase/arogenate dehydrogenase family protein [Betaproteobacteria bacterium]
MKDARAKKRSGARGRPSPVGKLVVFGVGLIGGSLALALKKRKSVARVVGVGRSRANLLAARRLGIIDEIATDAALAVQDADLVLLAAPLGQTAAVLAQIAPHLSAKTIVTDAGSTKRDVIAHARKYLGAAFARFVPAHPIAGTEKSGARAAFAELFDGHKLIVTPERETDARAVTRVSAMWKLAGMRVTTMRAADHDHIYALVSHLPHVLAFALVGQLAGYGDAATLFGHTGGGFRDSTRIAGSSPEMWRDICLANREALLAALDDYLEELELLRGMIEASDGQGLEARFAAARAARAKWLVKK